MTGACPNCGSAPEVPCHRDCPRPRETVRDGVRYCRHHGGERIREHGAPCAQCWKEERDDMAIMPDDEPIGTHPSDDAFPWECRGCGEVLERADDSVCGECGATTEDAAPVPVVRDDAALVAEVDEVF